VATVRRGKNDEDNMSRTAGFLSIWDFLAGKNEKRSNMAPITPVFSTQSVLPDEGGRRIVRCFGGEVACCARASRSRFGKRRDFSPFFPFSLFFISLLAAALTEGDGRGERSSRTTLKQDNGPQQHAARDADTKKGGIRSAVPPSSWSSATGWSAREKLLQRLALMPRLLLPSAR